MQLPQEVAVGREPSFRCPSTTPTCAHFVL